MSDMQRLGMQLDIVDSHVHVGINNMPNHCLEFFKDQNLALPKSASDFVKELENDESVRVNKIFLIPSFVCATDHCTDGVYSQADWAKEYKDIFVQFGTLNPHCEVSVREELDQQRSKADIRAIKLHPLHHCFKPNDYRKEERGLEKLRQIYEYAVDSSMSVMIHTGTSIGAMSRNKYAEPIFCDDVLKDFPTLKIIMAHAGRPFWFDEAFFFAKFYKNVYLELSGIAPKRIRTFLPRLDEITDKILYGSDYPNVGVNSITGHARDFANLVSCDKRVLRNNALSILGIS